MAWNPIRIEQRYGRIVRTSSGFRKVPAKDVFTPVLDVEVDRRLFKTVVHRRSMIDLVLPHAEVAGPKGPGDSLETWELPNEVLKHLTVDA